MAASTPAKHVVVDAGGFIRNAPIREIGEHVYTVAEVVHESCDKATRQRLQVLPYTINFKQPSSEAIVTVSDFAKKTGDYRHLSATDIKVIALTYILEKEHVGTEHIRKEPANKPPEYVVSNRRLDKPTDIAGFYVRPSAPAKGDGSEKDSAKDGTSESLQQKEDLTQEKENRDVPDSEVLSNQSQPDKAVDKDDVQDNKAEEVLESENADGQEGEQDGTQDSQEQTEAKRTTQQTADSQSSDVRADGDVLPESALEEGGDDEEEEEEEEDDDDGGGWITPSNIQEVKRRMGDTSAGEKRSVEVACLTTDFAMQNVLIQMGLNVVSVDGMLIKRAKSYVLRCFACMKITYNTSKVFCPHCGNKTLKRVAMTRDEDGTVHYYFSRRPLNTRGMRYPLPMPKGGKHAVNPILVEDQPLPQQRASKKSQQKMDIFSADYVAGSSPFAVNDVTSRAAQLGISSKHSYGANAYWNKRNPNEAKKKRGRRK